MNGPGTERRGRELGSAKGEERTTLVLLCEVEGEVGGLVGMRDDAERVGDDVVLVVGADLVPRVLY